MLTSLFVIVLVKLADQLLKNRPHGVVIHGREPDRTIVVEHRVGAQIDVRVEELLNQGAECISLGQCGDLVAELEVFQDVLDVLRKTIQVVLEVLAELLLVAP